MPLLVAAGFAAGTIIAILTVLAEHSRIAFGGYALYGNGALIVPALLVPFALYPGWLWALDRGGRALELALFVVGLHLGVGTWALLDTSFFARTESPIGDALPGLLFTGTYLVVPASLLAGLAYWVLSSGRVALGAPAIAVAVVAAFLLVPAYWAGLGLLAGMSVAAARRAPARRVVIGAALLVAIVVVGNLPYLPALIAREPAL